MTVNEKVMRVRRIELPGSKVQDEMIFFNAASGQYCSIDAVGITIWEFLEGKMPTVIEICDYLLGEFDVDAETCQRDVTAFLARMSDVGLLELVTE